MGLSTQWDKERGFGERSWRYLDVINNGEVEKICIEGQTGVPVQNSGPDPFEVSDADTMIAYLESAKKDEL